MLIAGKLACGALLGIPRVSCNRALPKKMNAFFVVTVMLGSTLATILLSRGAPGAPPCGPATRTRRRAWSRFPGTVH